MKLSSEEHISRVLFEADLLNTCCVANEAFDEYDRLAAQLNRNIVENDYTINEAMLENILHESLSLDDDEAVSDYGVSQAGINRVVNDLKEYLIINFSK